MNYLRYVFVIAGVLILLMGLGFAFQVPLATATWPWPDGRLSYLFIGSILTAVSASMVWIGWTGEWGALPGATLNVLVIVVTATIYLVRLTLGGHAEFIAYAAAGLLAILIGVAAFLWSRKIPLSDGRPMPSLVRLSFGVFMVALVLAAAGLILRRQVFPWDVKPDSSVIFGCIFLGNAVYFLYGLLRPRWYNAVGQLLSFLAYDLVLIVPFLLLLGSVKPEHMLSLIVYIVVLIYSGAIAVYFLFVDRKTKLGSS